MSTKKRETKIESHIIITSQSVFGNQIVLTKNVFDHIVERHPELASFDNLIELIKNCIEKPDIVARGRTDESIALIQLSSKHKFLAVFYVEEGRVKTAFVTSKLQSFTRRGILWRK
jgi:hypothetical protein